MSRSDLPTVVVTETLSQKPAAWLEKHARLVWCSYEDREGLAEALRDARGLIVRTYTQVDDALLGLAPKLRVVGRAGVGLDNIDVSACRARDVEVVYTPDANTQAVVEYVSALIFDAIRPRVYWDGPIDPKAFHAMRKEHVGRQLDQLCLGIVGFGRIGKRVGRLAHALGVKMNVCDVLPEAQLHNSVEYPFTFCDHERLYAESDIITLHVDGRASNRHMIDGAALEHFRDDAMLINAARGMLVDAQALAAWAGAHERARVILDVHDPEPPADDYALYGLSNVRLLPHLAARTDQALENMSWVVEDVAAVLMGKEPRCRAGEGAG